MYDIRTNSRVSESEDLGTMRLSYPDRSGQTKCHRRSGMLPEMRRLVGPDRIAFSQNAGHASDRRPNTDGSRPRDGRSCPRLPFSLRKTAPCRGLARTPCDTSIEIEN